MIDFDSNYWSWVETETPATEYPLDISFDAAVKRAEELGKVIRAPFDDELLLDIDSQEAYDQFQPRAEKLFGYLQDRFFIYVIKSKDPGHYHAYIQVPGKFFTQAERALLQAVLGSDINREFYSAARILSGEPKPTLFFENPDTDTTSYRQSLEGDPGDEVAF